MENMSLTLKLLHVDAEHSMHMEAALFEFLMDDSRLRVFVVYVHVSCAQPYCAWVHPAKDHHWLCVNLEHLPTSRHFEQ